MLRGWILSKKIRIAFTRDFFDKDGNFIMPGPGPNVFEDMLNIEWQMLAEYLPEMTLNRVVFPAPFGPIIEQTSCSWISRLTLLMAIKPPNDLFTFFTSKIFTCKVPIT